MMEFKGSIELKKEYEKHFDLVDPKKMVDFVDLYRKGELYALDLRDNRNFLLTEEHKDEIVAYVNAGVFLFGTVKLKDWEGKVDAIEIQPIIALDKHNNPTTYDKAVGFEVCEEGEEAAWGVYIHVELKGNYNLFDVVDKKNAELAEKVLEKLYNL